MLDILSVIKTEEPIKEKSKKSEVIYKNIYGLPLTNIPNGYVQYGFLFNLNNWMWDLYKLGTGTDKRGTYSYIVMVIDF